MLRRTFTVLAITLGAFAGATLAQEYPAKPVKFLVPFPPAGGTDVVTRASAQSIGSQRPNGYTLARGQASNLAINPSLYSKMPFDPLKDFQPIAMVGVTPNLLICNESQPAKTVKDIVELCKKNPGKVSFGSAGNGSAQHLALEMFMLQAGVKAIHVPYKGSGPMLTDLIGGTVQYSFDTMTAATPHVKSGKAIAIAQTRQARAKSYPNVPTMAESGFPGFEATTWYGLVGPGKMPVALAKRMNEDVNKALQMPDVIERLVASGAEDGGGSTEKFAEFMKVELAKWAKVIKEAGVKVEI